VATSAVVEEQQEQLPAWEEELTWREEALVVWEKKARIFEMALVQVSANLDAEWAKPKDPQKEYLNKMEAHTTHTKHSLGLEKMLGEKKVQHNGREWGLGLHEAALVEVQSLGFNPLHNHQDPMELVQLWRLRWSASLRPGG
jgi:hypothetical protein